MLGIADEHARGDGLRRSCCRYGRAGPRAYA